MKTTKIKPIVTRNVNVNWSSTPESSHPSPTPPKKLSARSGQTSVLKQPSDGIYDP